MAIGSKREYRAGKVLVTRNEGLKGAPGVRKWPDEASPGKDDA
jgi:hypothetical protein